MGEKKKVKLFHYTISNKGGEIHGTLPFSHGPTKHSLKDVINAFETHSNLKKNKTVERYKFFTRVQEGELLKEFIIDLKILASTCNFSTLWESLVHDQIICGIRDSKLRGNLLKVADLDLDKCVNACRASKLSKERNRASRQRQKQSIISLAETKKEEKKDKRDHGRRDDKDVNRKLILKCKFCRQQHQQGNYPVYGVGCQKCHKSIHFVSVCMSRRLKPVHTVESHDENASNYNKIKTVKLNPVDKINTMAASKFPKHLFATINVGKTPVCFQLDSGASYNIILAKTLENCLGEVELKKTTKRLSMYNRTTVQPLGLCQLELYYTENKKVYQVEFTVLGQKMHKKWTSFKYVLKTFCP